MKKNTRKEDKASFEDRLLAPLAPFAPETWIVILFASLYMALSYRFIVSDNERSSWYSQSKMRKKSKAYKYLGELGIGFYNSIVALSLADGDVIRGHRGLSSEGRILMFGYSIFAFMVMSAYTASFTLGLVTELEPPTSAQSLREIAQTGGKVCLLSSVAKSVSESFPFLEENTLLLSEDNDEIVKRMKLGLCFGGIMTDTAHRLFRARDQEWCENTFTVEGVVRSVDVGMPVSIDFLPALNFAIDTTDASLFEELSEDFTSELVGPALCPENTVEDLEEQTDNELGLSIVQMFLPIITTLICSTLACLSRLYKRTCWGRSRVSIFSKAAHTLDDKDMAGIAIVDEIKDLTTSELYAIAQRNNQTDSDSAVLQAAVDSLPDKTALMTLAQSVLQSKEHRAIVTELRSLSVYQLFRKLSKDPELKQQALAALDADSPKDALLCLIFGSQDDGDWHFNASLFNKLSFLLKEDSSRRMSNATLSIMGPVDGPSKPYIFDEENR